MTSDHDYACPIPGKLTKAGSEKKSRRNCCVPLCTNNGYKEIEGHGKLSYHSFPPVDDPLRKRWLINIKRDEDKTFVVKGHTRVCSVHFSADQYEVHTYSGRRYLLRGAVPTIFECWKSNKLVYKQIKQRPLNKLQQSRANSVQNDSDTVSEVNLESENCEATLMPRISPTSCTLDKNNQVSSSDLENMKNKLENFMLVEEIKKLTQKLNNLEQANSKYQNQVETLQRKLKASQFSVENISDSDFNFYTGFPSRTLFESVLKFLNPGPNGENIVLNCSTILTDDDGVKRGRPRKLSPANHFFLFLCRVKAGLFELDLANRFGISVSTVSNIIITWANFLYLRLGGLNIWATKEQVVKSMPASFKEKYPSTRVIIDCTEIKVEMPSSLLLKSQTYSNYKSANTFKGLVGISPLGNVTFVSQLYTGSISDREITERSGLLLMPFNSGDSVMADKGFDIQDLLDPLGVQLNIPPFLGLQGQMSGSEVLNTQTIASERIHVERAINRIKNFHIFDQIIPLSLAGSINQIWTVCALLTLFQEPIISVSANTSN